MRAKPGSRHCDVGSDCQHLPSTAHFSTFSCAEWCPANFLMCPIMILCLLKMKGNTPHLGFYNCTGVLRAEKHSFYFILFFLDFHSAFVRPFCCWHCTGFCPQMFPGTWPPLCTSMGRTRSWGGGDTFMNVLLSFQPLTLPAMWPIFTL